jgi:hypothetical protein
LTIVPFDTLDPAQSKIIQDDKLSEKESSPCQESMSASSPPSNLAGPPHVHHERFFFDDGNITFLVSPSVPILVSINLDEQSKQVEGILYRVHQYFFCRDSSEFKDRISRLPTQQLEESASPPIIPIDDVKSVDFDAFLSILYPQCVCLSQ